MTDRSVSSDLRRSDGTELPEGLLKIGAVARRFGVTPQSVREWVKEGRLTCFVSPGGTRLFAPDAVARFAATWKRPQRIYRPSPIPSPSSRPTEREREERNTTNE